LLDETVVLRQLRPRRDAAGRLCLRRIYGFEFTRSGGERDKGYATLMGHRVTGVHLDAVDTEPAGRHMLH